MILCEYSKWEHDTKMNEIKAQLKNKCDQCRGTIPYEKYGVRCGEELERN